MATALVRTLPNLVTAARGATGPLAGWLVVAHDAHMVAFWLFLVAMSTDMVDGFLARKLDARTRMGLWLDPLSDKVLTDSLWLALWWKGFSPAWLSWAMVGRDLMVSTVWAAMAARGRRFEPSPFGQVMVSFESVALAVLVFRGPWLDVHWPTVGIVLGGITVGLSVASVIHYAWTGPLREPPTV